MNHDIITTEQRANSGQGAKSIVENVRSRANENLQAYEKQVRQSPKKAMLIALGAGYCLNRLPVAALLAAPIRLTAVLAKPALLVLGATKLYEIIKEPSRK